MNILYAINSMLGLWQKPRTEMILPPRLLELQKFIEAATQTLERSTEPEISKFFWETSQLHNELKMEQLAELVGKQFPQYLGLLQKVMMVM